MVRVLATICVLAGCYTPPEPVCGFRCGPLDECPEHYSCNVNRQCQLDGTPQKACVVDGGFDPGPIDSAPDAPVNPVVTWVTPPAGATGINPAVTIEAQFDRDVLAVTTSSFLVSIGGTPLGGTVSMASFEDQRLWAFTPTTVLPSFMTVDVVLTTDIHDAGGNALAPAYTWSFQTGN